MEGGAVLVEFGRWRHANLLVEEWLITMLSVVFALN